MKATEELRDEHAAVLVAVDILDRVTTAIVAKDDRAPGHLGQLLDFFQGFVDRCHHAKEDGVLFPELERRGVPRAGGPIGVLLGEHDAGRGHVRELGESLARLRGGDAGAAATIRQRASTYRDMLQPHIRKENEVLFPMADRLIPAEVDAILTEQFEAIERERVGEGKHEAYHAMLHGLKEHYGVG